MKKSLKARKIVILLIAIVLLSLFSCGKKTEKKVEFKANAEKISINTGETFDYKISKDGINLIDVVYTSNDINVASVDKKGTVKAINNGSTKINATYEGQKFELNVTVLAKKYSLKFDYKLADKINRKQNVFVKDTEIEFKIVDENNNEVDGATISALDNNIVIDNNKLIFNNIGKSTLSIKKGNDVVNLDFDIIEEFDYLGNFRYKLIVPEMDNTEFIFNLYIRNNNTFEFIREETEFKSTGKKIEKEILYQGQFEYNNGVYKLSDKLDNKQILFYLALNDSKIVIVSNNPMSISKKMNYECKILELEKVNEQ